MTPSVKATIIYSNIFVSGVFGSVVGDNLSHFGWLAWTLIGLYLLNSILSYAIGRNSK